MGKEIFIRFETKSGVISKVKESDLELSVNEQTKALLGIMHHRPTIVVNRTVYYFIRLTPVSTGNILYIDAVYKESRF